MLAPRMRILGDLARYNRGGTITVLGVSKHVANRLDSVEGISLASARLPSTVGLLQGGGGSSMYVSYLGSAHARWNSTAAASNKAGGVPKVSRLGFGTFRVV